jgi:transcriptional regulator with XRE-family HTH domain
MVTGQHAICEGRKKMGQKIIKGSVKLAKAIKHRRNELNFTIEEAASKAGVGTKTWSRYEAGESIRKDKSRGICKALNWLSLPDNGEFSVSGTLDCNDYMNRETWSLYLMDMFGKYAATSFVIGSDLLLDNLREDMKALSSMPKGTHIGELDASWLASLLPQQFLIRYDYDFLYVLHNTVIRFRAQASSASQIMAHSVIEELTLYLIVEEAQFLMECIELNVDNDDIEAYDNWNNWIFDLFGDMNLITCLYSDIYLTNDHTYHFEHWLENQFFLNRCYNSSSSHSFIISQVLMSTRCNRVMRNLKLGDGDYIAYGVVDSYATLAAIDIEFINDTALFERVAAIIENRKVRTGVYAN